MKYFVNYPYTAESLKREYRELCKKLHPDTGGNAQDFAEMMNEYEQTARNLNGNGTTNKARTAANDDTTDRRRLEENNTTSRRPRRRVRPLLHTARRHALFYCWMD